MNLEPLKKREPIPARDHLEDLGRRLDAVDREVEELALGLTPTQLRWRPAPEKWSIAHCLEHLIQMTDLYEDPVLAGVAGSGREPAPKGGGEYAPGWLGRLLIHLAGPDGKMKLRAPGSLGPPPDVPGRVRERFATSQEHLRRFLSAAKGCDLVKSRVKHPVVPLLTLGVGECLEMLVAHQRRHLEQAKRVRGDAGFPVSPLG